MGTARLLRPSPDYGTKAENVEEMRLVDVEDEGPGETRKQCKTCGRWADLESGFYAAYRLQSAVVWAVDCRRCQLKSVRIRKEFRSSPAFGAMLRNQGHRCKCCGRDLPEEKDAVVDHDHKTGRVRGILCGNCNLGGGHLGDTLEAGVRWALYISRSSE